MYFIIWRYEIKPNNLQTFLEYYSPSGKWADLFRISRDYFSTELLKLNSNNTTYLTIDKWSDETAYNHFLYTHQSDYKKLDLITEKLTLEEELIGMYVSLE